MCLIIFSHQPGSPWPLLVAANRDEFYARPSTPSQFWPEHPNLLAGQDEEAGGTWMGVTRQGRFAAITNYRDPAATQRSEHSRGLIVRDYLTSQDSTEQFLRALQDRTEDYADFNLLAGDGEELWYFSSLTSAKDNPRQLPPGVYGLSNAQLDTPWPKVILGKSLLEKHLEQGETINHDSLIATISSPELADRDALQTLNMNSGMDQLLSAQFICAGTYGTRSGTTLLKSANGELQWREQLYDEQGATFDEKHYNFALEPA